MGVDEPHAGLERARTYPLFAALANRRSRRISKGLAAVHAGSLTYQPAVVPKPEPLSPLEEAVLIAATGTTGVTLPDRPFEDGAGNKILGTPNLTMLGRAAGSTDNAQATHFFLINDEGVYFLRRVEAPAAFPTTPEELIQRAARAKQLVHPGRPEFPRQFPYYLDSNRFLANVPGSTILFPVVDMTRQYINALMYLLTEQEGNRPTFLDDRNFYCKAGVKRWVRQGAPPRPPPPTYANAGSHWWDASQIYGDDEATARRLRSDPGGSPVPFGQLYLHDGLLPYDPTDPNNQIELTGFAGNWWIGLSWLHTLFVREHNAICVHLHEEYPEWNDERLYQTARLVNAALMAKIHTVEWTPAILPNPALKIGMPVNWWGLLTEPVKKVFGRISANEASSGITGSLVNHHAADYSLTEEFVSVYRMHPLVRDDISVYAAATGEFLHKFDMHDLVGAGSRERALAAGGSLANLLYSFGVCHPGALVLRNYPVLLRDFKRDDGDRIDLGAIDILRDRERGVPRYNQFRAFLHLPRFRSLDHMIAASEQLRNDKALADQLRRIYGNDIERVDLMVGLFAETPPPLFGFSDTAFRIFILMASRRLKSDRFFTPDFTPDVYSPAGFAWVNDNTMRTVLLRHYPELASALRGVDNAFAPWQTIEQSRAYQPHETDQK
jgi:hypothetical protein